MDNAVPSVWLNRLKEKRSKSWVVEDVPRCTFGAAGGMFGAQTEVDPPGPQKCIAHFQHTNRRSPKTGFMQSCVRLVHTNRI